MMVDVCVVCRIAAGGGGRRMAGTFGYITGQYVDIASGAMIGFARRDDEAGVKRDGK
jgi:hypothetical protein